MWRYMRLFRADILSAQPERLYRARLAEFKTPFFRSFLVGEPDLIDVILRERPRDFPKSDRIAEGLRPLLGDRSVFLTNGATWARQRRIIDPAYAHGRVRTAFPQMMAAAEAAVARLAPGEVEMEETMSHAAADTIFRTLFSIPIEHEIAAEVFRTFRAYQRAQPIVNLGALVPLPRWMPRMVPRAARQAAGRIRALIGELTASRQAAIAAGTAPDDLATKIMTSVDPETGARLSQAEMIDQVAIFFLAGHETSAAAQAWALWLLASAPEWQERVAAEALAIPTESFGFSEVSGLALTRDVFREALRLYPPVPMMVRAATRAERFRDRAVAPGAQLVVSPWHLHRNPRYWTDPDKFDPGRWAREEGRRAARQAYLPYSAGPRVCPGAGFAALEGVVMLAHILRAYRLETVPGRVPIPVAHLTVRAREGVWLRLRPRHPG